MAISFGGLATGIDTTALIEGLLAVERVPIERLNSDINYQNSRLSALTQLNSSLSGLLSKTEGLDSTEDLTATTGKLSGEELVSISASSSAFTGSYSIKSFTFAQVEKNVSQGYADSQESAFGTGTITLTIGTTDPQVFEITIDETNNSLEGIVGAINDLDAGVSAAIISDGTASPYRIVLSGNQAGDPLEVGFSIDAGGLTGGTYANPLFSETQPAQQAHISVDGIDMYSNSNTFEDSIPGVALTLLKADNGATTATLTVDSDTDKLKSKLQDFVTSYNKVVSFITGQSATEGKAAGILVGDSGVNAIKRRLQNLLTTRVDLGQNTQTLAEIGFKTQKDGTISIDQTKLNDVLASDREGLSKLLLGDGDSVTGIMGQFGDYLKNMTNSTEGFLAGRKTSINDNIRGMNNQIQRIEARLSQREETLMAQFTAMEQLVSTLNAQSSYLTQQMNMLSNLWSKK